jgi:hypothetical protein
MTRGDYSTTCVYEIVCKNNDKVPKYIGFTTNLTQRKHYHKRNMSNTNNIMYSVMKENGGFNNWDIRILDECDCSNAEEARNLLNNYHGYIREIDRPQEFRCETCYYVSNLRANYNIHCKTSRHLANVNNNVSNQDKPNEITNLVVELVKQNKEQMTEMIKINQEQMKQTQQMIEICNRPTQVTNTTNNNSFCLNVFLNETCKDAIDMDYFIDNMVVTVEEIMRQANMSFEDGFAAILKDRLCDKMSITERPIHFTDTKRETIIYKDKEKNEWIRDENQTIPTEMCRGVTKQMSKYVCENRHLLPNHIFDNVMMNSWPANEKQRSKVMRTIMPYLCVPKEGTPIGNKTQFSSAK